MSVGGDLPSGCCPQPDLTGIETALTEGLGSVTLALGEIDGAISQAMQQATQDAYDSSKVISDQIKAQTSSYEHYSRSAADEISQAIAGETEAIVQEGDVLLSSIQVGADCGTPEGEGKPCSSCGCMPCICADGTCETIDPLHCMYVGWYSIAAHNIVVTRADEPGPGGDFESAGEFADSEAAKGAAEDLGAVLEERAFQLVTEEEPDLPDGPPINFRCDISSYSGEGLSAFAGMFGAAHDIFDVPATFVKEFREFGFEGLNLGTLQDVMYGTAKVLTGMPFTIVDKWTPKIASALVCGNPTFVNGAKLLSTLGVMDKIAGIDLTEFAAPTKYAMLASCRNHQLQPKEAMDVYLSTTTGDFDIDTHFAIAGLCEPITDWMIQASKAKPDPEQLVSMRHRSIIDESTYNDGMRQLGYIDTDVVANIFSIAEQLPDIGTIAGFLQQAATSDELASRWGYDEGLGEFEAGTLHDYIHGIGISDDTAKYFWRSHWRTPGVGQFAEFYRILRDDETFGGDEQLLTDISDSLTSLGIPPFWQKHHMATLLQPLALRQMRLAFTAGAITDDELLPAMRKTGADDQAIDTIIRELKPARRHAMQQHLALRNWIHQHVDGEACKADLALDGFNTTTVDQAMRDAEPGFQHSTWGEAFTKNMITRDQLVAKLTAWGVTETGASAIADTLSYKMVDHQSVKDYMAGTTSRENAASVMMTDGMNNDTTEQLLRNADSAIADASNMECTRGLRERYVRGELDYAEVNSQLNQFGLDPARVNQITAAFDCAKKADGTHVAVEKLCHWLYLGIIGPADFLQRVLRLGYSQANAEMLLADCLNANTLRQIKEAKAVVKQQQATLKAAMAAQAKVNATIQRNDVRLADARKKQKQIRSNRDKQLILAAERLYKLTAEGLGPAVQAAKDAVAVAQSTYGLSLDESLAILSVAASKFPKGSIADFPQHFATMAEAAATSGAEPVIEDVDGVPIVNGDTQPLA